MKYHARHAAPRDRRRSHTLAGALALGVALSLAATPAYAGDIKPRRGEGAISMVTRECGSARGWQAIASAAGIRSGAWTVYYGRTYNLDCRKTTVRSNNKASRSSSRVDTVVAYARAQIGDPYVFGAAGPNAFDCSGLVVAAYRQIGIRLPHYTGSLLGRGTRVSRANLRVGDLVFPSRGHVGIYIGNNKMIVAPHPGARVRIQSVYAFYAGRRIL